MGRHNRDLVPSAGETQACVERAALQGSRAGNVVPR